MKFEFKVHQNRFDQVLRKHISLTDIVDSDFYGNVWTL